ncbi:MAG: tRNA (adenosine(37)-N6)-dimethylallyltransferase MiaA [Patescibacteria group bacterium]
MANSKVLIIVGPTASGKTALSLLLAKKYNGEIVSADSRQIYCEMNIGTAKATLQQQKVIKHHLIDIKNPNQNYSVGQFKKDAIAAVNDITSRSRLPIVVGGTAQYIYALVDNWQIPAVRADKKLRAKIERNIAEQGLPAVYKKLLDLDPEAAYVVDPKNSRRVVRALEVAITTGQPFTAQRRAGEPLFDFLLIGLRGTPETLKARITRRTRRMITAGLVKEVKGLLKKYGRQQKVFDTIGYREIIQHLNGELTLNQAIQKIVINTRRFARRQMQWFKRDEQIHWVNASVSPIVPKLLTDWLGHGWRPLPGRRGI